MHNSGAVAPRDADSRSARQISLCIAQNYKKSPC